MGIEREKDSGQDIEGSGHQPVSEKPQSLRGDWADVFPQDLDVGAELKNIRGEWEKEWHEDELLDEPLRR